MAGQSLLIFPATHTYMHHTHTQLKLALLLLCGFLIFPPFILSVSPPITREEIKNERVEKERMRMRMTNNYQPHHLRGPIVYIPIIPNSTQLQKLSTAGKTTPLLEHSQLLQTAQSNPIFSHLGLKQNEFCFLKKPKFQNSHCKSSLL